MITKLRVFVAGACTIIMTACACGPARWAEQLEHKVQCGMTIKEVSAVAERPVKELNRSWATHYIGEEVEATEVWLTFKDDKLQSIQLAWMYRLKRMASAQRVELCSPSPKKE